jgi:hypothetical protein
VYITIANNGVTGEKRTMPFVKSFRIEKYRAKADTLSECGKSWETDFERLLFDDIEISNGIDYIDLYGGSDAIQLCTTCGAPNPGSYICLRRTEGKVFWIPARFSTEEQIDEEERVYSFPSYFSTQGIPAMGFELYSDIQKVKRKNLPRLADLLWLTGQEAFRIFLYENRFRFREILGLRSYLIDNLRVEAEGTNEVILYKEQIVGALPVHSDEVGNQLERVFQEMEKYKNPVSEAPLLKEDQVITFITDIPALREWSPIAVGSRGMGLLLPESLTLWYSGLVPSEWWNGTTSRVI